MVSLMSTEEFKDLVDSDLWKRMDFIRKLGNNAAHNGKKITLDEARLCLENLYIFLDFVAYCYGEQYVETKFNPELLDKTDSFEERQASQSSEIDLKASVF